MRLQYLGRACVCIHLPAHFFVPLYSCIFVRTRVCTCAAEAPRWQVVSIMINRQTRQLSHAITLHYGSQDFKVKMNGSSSTWRLHISSFLFFLFFCWVGWGGCIFFLAFVFWWKICLFFLSLLLLQGIFFLSTLWMDCTVGHMGLREKLKLIFKRNLRLSMACFHTMFTIGIVFLYGQETVWRKLEWPYFGWCGWQKAWKNLLHQPWI